MTYALLVIETPENVAHVEEPPYTQLLNAISPSIMSLPKNRVLAENVLLLDLETEMHTLSHIVVQAKARNCRCHTLFSDTIFPFANS